MGAQPRPILKGKPAGFSAPLEGTDAAALTEPLLFRCQTHSYFATAGNEQSLDIEAARLRRPCSRPLLGPTTIIPNRTYTQYASDEEAECAAEECLRSTLP